MMGLRLRLATFSGFMVLALACMPTHATVSGDADAELLGGLAKFALASGDPAAALRYTRNLSSEASQLVRARAMIATGTGDAARGLLEQLMSGQYYRGQAALMLANLATSRGEPEIARQHLETAAKLSHGDSRQQALYQLAEIQRQAGETDRAGQVLASMEPGYWSALGYMNLAADYGKRDLNPSRALVALRVALAMSEEDFNSRRSEELKSRLLVRAGHLAHQHEDHAKAISFLEKVPLESYSTPQGLYLHGLALSASGNHRAAMQSWHRAKKYPLAYPGVANAWLGTGRGYDLSGYLGQAGEAYLAASASFESERVTLRKLASRIHSKGAYQALVRDARDSNAQWFLADSRTLTQPRTAYLLRFMEQAEAQEAVKRVAELESIDRQFAQREVSLDVFRSALKERLQSANASVAGAAGFDDRVQALNGRIASLTEGGASGAQQEALRGAARTLADLKSSLGKLDQRLAARDQHLNELLLRTEEAGDRVRELRSRASRLQTDAEKVLDTIALAFVEDQDDRMAFALDRTEQQIAHLYEYLALQNIQRGEP